MERKIYWKARINVIEFGQILMRLSTDAF